jgi:hypothetical protein
VIYVAAAARVTRVAPGWRAIEYADQASRYYDFGPINALIAAWQAESRSLM